MKRRLFCLCLALGLLFCSVPVFAAGGDAFERNDTFAQAVSVGFPFRLSAGLHTVEDVDWYAFDLPGGTLTLSLTDTQGRGGFTLRLFDEKENALASSDETQASPSIVRTLPAGRYYARVEGLLGDYTLSAALPGAQAKSFSPLNMVTTLEHPDAPDRFSTSMRVGGNLYMAQAYLLGWRGPVSESADPYPDEIITSSGYVANIEQNTSYTPLAGEAHVQDMLVLPKRTGPLDNRAIKNALYAYGAVAARMHVDWDSFDGAGGPSSYTYYWYDGDYPQRFAGHIVAIVGYDDSFPKERFASCDETGATPAGDGAFIVKNSWGDQEGETGFFYISYYDTMFAVTQPSAVFLGVQSARNYNTLYEHDLYGYVEYITGTQPLYCANVYRAARAQALRAVSFCTVENGQSVDIFVQVGDGAMQQVWSGSKTYAGYYTVRLSADVPVSADTPFRVIVRYNVGAGGKCYIPIDCVSAGYSDASRSERGQSLYGTDGASWADLYDLPDTDYGNFCIKAYTYDAASSSALTRGEERSAASSDGALAAPAALAAKEAQSDGPFALGGAEAIQQPSHQAAEVAQLSLPTAFDLRTLGGTTPARNQGILGSCWAFGALASLESCMLRAGNMTNAFPNNVALDKSEVTIDLLKESPDSPLFTATATAFGPDVLGTDAIKWSLSGDLGSIDILSENSRSGQPCALFRAKYRGTVTVCAVSTADETRMATATVHILGNLPPSNHSGPQTGPAAPTYTVTMTPNGNAWTPISKSQTFSGVGIYQFRTEAAVYVNGERLTADPNGVYSVLVRGDVTITLGQPSALALQAVVQVPATGGKPAYFGITILVAAAICGATVFFMKKK